jgi:7,8-dihydro-6-hydroxymethylpterin dimethyltransferase
VAFHVDMTQQRKGFANEIELNAIRQEYIERARGLRLAVMFNTTVINGNFDQIPEIVAFFVRNADMIRLASFQIQADTGRGVLGRRDARLSVDSVKSQMERGTGAPLSFETARAGHFRCNRYAMSCVVNGKVYDVLDDQLLFADILEQTKHLQFDRQDRSAALAAIAKGVLGCPLLALRAAGWLARKVWRARLDLVRARGRVHKLSFFTHDFMDACRLEPDRIEACVFAAPTADGPISMCLHNAKRDAFISQYIRLAGEPKGRFWNPVWSKNSNVGRTCRS